MVSHVTAISVSGLDELAQGMRQWRVSHWLGIGDLRHRYARSKLGQLWLVFSTAVMVVALGIVWSLLWNQAIGKVMTFIGVGLIIWNFLAQVLTECTCGFYPAREGLE